MYAIENKNLGSTITPNSNPPTEEEEEEPVPTVNSWNDAEFPAGIEDEDCMDSDKYNACLIYKNPVFAKGSRFSPTLTKESSNASIEKKIMTYGINLPLDKNLQNNHFVIVSDFSRPDPTQNNDSWKFPLQNDASHFVTQLNVFYWLNRQVSFMKEYTGAFFYKNKKSKIYAYDPSVKSNASFIGSGIKLGYLQLSSSHKKGDVGLDLSVVSHEAGHGNLYFASNGAGVSSKCPNKNGCFGAIHEGQADVHSFLLFPETPVLGEYFMNSMHGLRNPASIKEDNISAQELYNHRNGEIHDMGEAYASIWWEVYNRAQTKLLKQKIAEVFTDHLLTLDSNDNFTSAYSMIEILVKQKFSSQNENLVMGFFTEEYNRLGIDLP